MGKSFRNDDDDYEDVDRRREQEQAWRKSRHKREVVEPAPEPRFKPVDGVDHKRRRD